MPFSDDFTRRKRISLLERLSSKMLVIGIETNDLIINKANFTISKGEMIGVIGESGSGKAP